MPCEHKCRLVSAVHLFILFSLHEQGQLLWQRHQACVPMLHSTCPAQLATDRIEPLMLFLDFWGAWATINTKQTSGRMYIVTSGNCSYAKQRKSAVSVVQARRTGLQDQS